MSKDARNEDLDLSPTEKAAFDELVAVLAKHGFGEAGPPRETSFAQIEQFGHRAGRMLARAMDVCLTKQHAAHFADEEPCPRCQQVQRPKQRSHELDLETEDGKVKLSEPAFRCPRCEQDFFPGTHPTAD